MSSTNSGPREIVYDLYEDKRLIRRQTSTATSITFGSGAAAMVRLEGAGIEELHIVINVDDGQQLSLLDLGSTEGTFLNGKRVRSAALKSGDEIRLGSIRIVPRVGKATPGEEQGQLEELLRRFALPAEVEPPTEPSVQAPPPAEAVEVQEPELSTPTEAARPEPAVAPEQPVEFVPSLLSRPQDQAWHALGVLQWMAKGILVGVWLEIFVLLRMVKVEELPAALDLLWIPLDTPSGGRAIAAGLVSMTLLGGIVQFVFAARVANTWTRSETIVKLNALPVQVLLALVVDTLLLLVYGVVGGILFWGDADWAGRGLGWILLGTSVVVQLIVYGILGGLFTDATEHLSGFDGGRRYHHRADHLVESMVVVTLVVVGWPLFFGLAQAPYFELIMAVASLVALLALVGAAAQAGAHHAAMGFWNVVLVTVQGGATLVVASFTTMGPLSGVLMAIVFIAFGLEILVGVQEWLMQNLTQIANQSLCALISLLGVAYLGAGGAAMGARIAWKTRSRARLGMLLGAAIMLLGAYVVVELYQQQAMSTLLEQGHAEQ